MTSIYRTRQKPETKTKQSTMNETDRWRKSETKQRMTSRATRENSETDRERFSSSLTNVPELGNSRYRVWEDSLRLAISNLSASWRNLYFGSREWYRLDAKKEDLWALAEASPIGWRHGHEVLRSELAKKEDGWTLAEASAIGWRHGHKLMSSVVPSQGVLEYLGAGQLLEDDAEDEIPASSVADEDGREERSEAEDEKGRMADGEGHTDGPEVEDGEDLVTNFPEYKDKLLFPTFKEKTVMTAATSQAGSEVLFGSKPSTESPIMTFMAAHKLSHYESAPGSRWPQRLSAQRNSGFAGGAVRGLRRDAVNERNEGGTRSRIAVPAAMREAMAELEKEAKRKRERRRGGKYDGEVGAESGSEDELEYFSAEEETDENR